MLVRIDWTESLMNGLPLRILAVSIWCVTSLRLASAATETDPIVMVSYEHSDVFDVNQVLRSACLSLLDHQIEDAKSRRTRSNTQESQGHRDLTRLLAVKADSVEAARIPKGVAYVVVATGAKGVRVAFYWPENIYAYSCIVDPKSNQVVASSGKEKLYSAILRPRSQDDGRGARKWDD